MKVLVVNGSPHLHGCTDRALQEVEDTLNSLGIDTERVNIGNKDVRGCIATTAVNMANVYLMML